MYRALLIFCFLLVVAATADEAADRFRRKDREISYGDTTREQVLETRNRRKRQLSNMILDARQKLADHAAGEITLTSDRKKALEDQMDIFQRKLDTMKEELEEWEIERLIARESNRAELRKQRSAASRRMVSDEI